MPRPNLPFLVKGEGRGFSGVGISFGGQLVGKVSERERGAVGHGSGEKRAKGKGAWSSSASTNRLKPWGKTATRRKRVAWRGRVGAGKAGARAGKALADAAASAAPPTLTSPKVATAITHHQRAARSGAGMRVACHGQPPRWVRLPRGRSPSAAPTNPDRRKREAERGESARARGDRPPRGPARGRRERRRGS
jgi:hypothetical protein